MDALLEYLNGLAKPNRTDFCRRCGTTEGYLRKAVSSRQRIGESLCISLDRESRGLVTCEALRPDVDWGYLRGSVHSPVQTTQEIANG